jgi:ubiquitin-protein ligase
VSSKQINIMSKVNQNSFTKTRSTDVVLSNNDIEVNNYVELQKSTYQEDNYVIDHYKSTKIVTEFLIKNAYSAMKSDRSNIIFKPLPATWNNTISNITNLIKNETKIIEYIENSYTDKELIEKIGGNTYSLLKYILSSNKILIKPFSLLESSDIVFNKSLSINGITSSKITNAKSNLSEESFDHSDKFSIDLNNVLLNIQQFKVIHTELVEDKLKGKPTVFLYHGSPYVNWYSIMRNGLKSGSTNEYFLNGSAYGNGIYLSNNISLSLSYSIRGNDCNKINNISILAIFEVIDNPEWKKTNDIFVVTDENALLMRYLIVFKNANDPINILIFNGINYKLNTGKMKEYEKELSIVEKKNIVTIHNKRLMKEYQNIMKQSDDSLGFKISLAEEDNLSKWNVYVTKPENDKLEKQMKLLNIQAIEIEIIFKENYPIVPPFIRIVYPHFKFHSGHITVGGSLCMEMLTNQGWSPTFNVENIITQIKLAINDGNGEIDEKNYSKRYTIEEAEMAFKRVVAAHGWV